MSDENNNTVNGPRITNWKAIDGETIPNAIDTITGFYPLTRNEAREEIERAIENGDISEDNSGMFTKLRVPGADADSVEGKTKDGKDVDVDTVQECLNVAIDWFHGQIDEEISHIDLDSDGQNTGTPCTARDYFETSRGWSSDTIKDKKLGYAPTYPDIPLYDYLQLEGYTREEVIATGLVREHDDGSLYTIWNGRYVFPYLNENGNAEFAISRATEPAHEHDWAGRYGEDDTPEKYHKLPSSSEDVLVDEPIFGLETIVPGKPVLITEGIADAITAHQAGYPCISPVTTQFSNKDIERLADILSEHEVTRAVIIQDAERASSDVVDTSTGDESLFVEQVSPGLKGAIKTASYLVRDGIDARIGELPRPGLEKVDLDDYLTRWDGDLDAVIRSAKPPSQHSATEPQKPSVDEARKQDQNNKPEVNNGEEKSALFDLDITDVTGWAVGDRGNNPLGHHGDSEDYFVIVEDKGKYAYDHKYKTAYNALTYLLCEAGHRPPSHPGGSLSDKDIWVAWKHAKERRYISDDDKCPAAALKHIALKHDLCNSDDIEDGWKLPAEAYREALELIEEEYEIDHGHDSEPIAPIPYERLQHLEWSEAKRYARKRGHDWPTTREARKRLEDEVVTAIASGDRLILDAPTALGKSYTVATFPWLNHNEITDSSPVVHLHATRDARDEAYENSVDAGLQAKRILGRDEACTTAAGDHDHITMNGEPASEWLERQCNEKGIPLSVAHTILEEENDQDEDLPCCEGESECYSKTQWDDVPWDTSNDDRNDPGGCSGAGNPAENDTKEEVKYDVIHATHQMLFVPSMSDRTNVVIDELPDFALNVGGDGNLTMDRIRRAVTAYLTEIDAPVTTWEDLMTLNTRRETTGDLWGEWADIYHGLREAIEERSPDLKWYVQEPDAHVLARAIINCIFDAFNSEPDRNGLRSGSTEHTLPRMDDGAAVRVNLVIDEDYNIKHIRQTPDLSNARSIVGLDAYPSMPLWQLNSLPSIRREEILSNQERKHWRLFERGLFVVQVGDATRPLSGDKALDWLDEDRLGALISELVSEGLNTAITTAQIETKLQEMLADEGVYDVEEKTMHYGEVRSRNDFSDEDIGFVNGCMDPGDDYVLSVLAEFGCDAVPETTRNGDGEIKRAHGRGFEGPDAETAGAILASVRENEVAQAAGRYARNADDADDRAVVYVRTDATPPAFADVQVPGVEWMATRNQKKVIDELKNNDRCTAREIADTTGQTKRAVLKTLRRLREDGLIDCQRGAAKYGADIYRAINGVTTPVLHNLGPGKTTNDRVLESNTWSFVILPPDTATSDNLPANRDRSQPDSVASHRVSDESPIQNRFKPEPPQHDSPLDDGEWVVDAG